jgi:hypothetical protein
MQCSQLHGAPVQLAGCITSCMSIHVSILLFQAQFIKAALPPNLIFTAPIRNSKQVAQQTRGSVLLCLPLNRHTDCEWSTLWLQLNSNSKQQSGPDRTHTQTEPFFGLSAVCITRNKRRLIYRC